MLRGRPPSTRRMTWDLSGTRSSPLPLQLRSNSRREMTRWMKPSPRVTRPVIHRIGVPCTSAHRRLLRSSRTTRNDLTEQTRGSLSRAPRSVVMLRAAPRHRAKPPADGDTALGVDDRSARRREPRGSRGESGRCGYPVEEDGADLVTRDAWSTQLRVRIWQDIRADA